MNTSTDEIQQLNASVWSITSQLMDDCEQIVSQLRQAQNHFKRPAYSHTSTLAVGTPQKRDFLEAETEGVSADANATVPGPRSALLQKYTAAGQSRVKRACMDTAAGLGRLSTSTPRLSRAAETQERDPFRSPIKVRLPEAIPSDI